MWPGGQHVNVEQLGHPIGIALQPGTPGLNPSSASASQVTGTIGTRHQARQHFALPGQTSDLINYAQGSGGNLYLFSYLCKVL